MTANLILHAGARRVCRAELDSVVAPAPTATWFPLSHGDVMSRVEDTIEAAGFNIRRADYALSRGDNRFFGTFDLEAQIADGVTLSVGVRNSTDKTLPIGFCAGSRVFVCDNLAFRSEVTIARKHTRNGEVRFAEALSLAVQSLSQFRAEEEQRVGLLKSRSVDDRTAESVILRALETKILSTRNVLDVLHVWREPTYPDFAPRTLWSLFNSFTEVLGQRSESNVQAFAYQTIRLNDLFVQAL